MLEREELADALELQGKRSAHFSVPTVSISLVDLPIILAALRDPGEADAVRGEEAQGATPRGPGSRPSDHAPADRDAARVDPSREAAVVEGQMAMQRRASAICRILQNELPQAGNATAFQDGAAAAYGRARRRIEALDPEVPTDA